MEDFYDIGFSDALQLNPNNQLYEINSDYTDGYNDGVDSSVVVAKRNSEGDDPVIEGIYIDFPSYKKTYRKVLKNRGINMKQYEKGYKDGSLSQPKESHEANYLLGYRDGSFQFNQAYSEGNSGYTLTKGHSNEFIKIYNEGRKDSESSARARGKSKKKKRKNKNKTKNRRK